MPPPASTIIPRDLRPRLEQARLDSLALFRALDQLDPALTPSEIPQRLLHQLFELDADCAEALWALDQSPGSLDFRTMVRDTLAALEQLSDARDRLRRNLPPRAHQALAALEVNIRAAIDPAEAYNDVPGRAPRIG